MCYVRYTLACCARVCLRFNFAHHFESHLAQPHPFYMRMRTTISDEHSIVTMLHSTRIIFSTYLFKHHLILSIRLQGHQLSRWPSKTVSLADEERFSWYASRGENARKVRLLCRLLTNFWLLTSMFSLLLSLTLGQLNHSAVQKQLTAPRPHSVSMY